MGIILFEQAPIEYYGPITASSKAGGLTAGMLLCGHQRIFAYFHGPPSSNSFFLFIGLADVYFLVVFPFGAVYVEDPELELW